MRVSVMKWANLIIVFLCAMCVLSVALFAANMFIGAEPFSIANLVIATIFGVGACIFGVRTLRRGVRNGSVRLASRALAGKQNLGLRLFFLTLLTLSAFILIFLGVGIRFNKLAITAPAAFWFASLLCLFLVRFPTVYRKYNGLIDSSATVGEVLNDLLGGRTGLIWLAIAGAASVAIAVLSSILAAG